MITILLAAAAVFAPVQVGEAEPVDAPALARYQSQCAGKSTPECKALQWRIEYSLYTDLRALWSTGAPLDRDVLDVAAGAECPQLASFALLRLGDYSPLSKDEQALVVAALESPYPAVHVAALSLAAQLPGERYRLFPARAESRPTENAIAQVTAVAPPPAADLVDQYRGARFRPFASGEERAWFTTTDAPEKVIAALSGGGKRPVLSAAELKSTQKKPKQPKNPEEMMKLMEQYDGDMMKMAKDMENAEQGSKMHWDADVAGAEGVTNPRFVVLAADARKVPTSVAIVFRDEMLGETSIVYPLHALNERRKADAAADLMKDPQAMSRRIQMQMQMQRRPR